MSRLFLTRYDDDFDAGDAYDPPRTAPPCPKCGECIYDIELMSEPDDPHYGADADGRRGVFMPGVTWVERAPDACPHCGVALTFDCDRRGNVSAEFANAADAEAQL